MAKQMSNMMETMTPEEIMEKSRQSQAVFEAAANPSIVDAQVIESVSKDDEEDEETEPIPPPDTEVLDTLYRMAELMSTPPTGKVTLAGFSTVPPVALLVGNDDERDLSKKELNECWADGSLGSSRVDRAGFERVWIEVQEYFSLPVMDKARERTVESKSVSVEPRVTGASLPTGAQVAQNISPEQLAQVKNMSDSDGCHVWANEKYDTRNTRPYEGDGGRSSNDAEDCRNDEQQPTYEECRKDDDAEYVSRTNEAGQSASSRTNVENDTRASSRGNGKVTKANQTVGFMQVPKAMTNSARAVHMKRHYYAFVTAQRDTE